MLELVVHMTDDSKTNRRVMLKLSGEVLQGTGQGGIDGATLRSMCADVKKLTDAGIKVAMVIGGGNFWRFRDQQELGFDRVLSDNMGMIATVMNAMAFQEALTNMGVRAKAFSALPMPSVLETYTPRGARSAFADYDVVICSGGTGNPYFTTDSAAALRALELKCEVMLKATKVDYVCDKDPKKFPDAQTYTTLTYTQVLEMGLEVMDLAAVAIAREGKLPIIVFNMQTPGNLEKVARGENIGTTIS
jgi:uridylate kinase